MLKCSGKVSADYSNCLIPASEKIVIKMARRLIQECGKEHGIPEQVFQDTNAVNDIAFPELHFNCFHNYFEHEKL